MAKSLYMDIIARDKASRVIKGTGNELDRAAKKTERFKGAMKVAGAAAGLLAVKFAKDSVNAYVEAEKAQSRLTDAFVRFPKLADTNADALRGLNEELAKKTRFDDDATASGQAVLAQFVDSGKQLRDLTPLLQDYAAKTGKDLPSAAKTMGKAFLGNTRALKDLGINYKMTGDKTKDMAAITELMREKVGGFAEKEGKTAAGQAEILRNQFGELQEDVGAKLVPVLQDLGERLLDVIDFIDRNKAVIVPLAKVIGGLTIAVVAVNKATKVWRATSAALDAVLSATGFRRAATDVGALATNTDKATTASGKLGGKKGLGGAAGMLSSGGVWGVAIAGAITVVGIFAAKHAKAKQRVDELATSLDTATGAITDESRAMVVSNLESDGVLKRAREMGVSLKDVTDAALGNEGAQRRVNTQLAEYATRAGKGRATAARYGGAQDGTRRKIDAVKDAIGSQNKAVDSARQKALRGAEALGKNSDALSKNRTHIERLQARIATLRGKIVKVGADDPKAERSRRKIQELQAQIDALHGKTVTIRAVTSGHVRQVDLAGRGFASGTPSAPRGWAWAGERGPELIKFRGGERVLTAPQSAAMTSSSSSSGPVELGDRTIAKIVSGLLQVNAALVHGQTRAGDLQRRYAT